MISYTITIIRNHQNSIGNNLGPYIPKHSHDEFDLAACGSHRSSQAAKRKVSGSCSSEKGFSENGLGFRVQGL